MTPTDYIQDLKQSGFQESIVNNVLTPREKTEAREILDVGFDFIGRKVSEHYDQMTPEAVRITNMLQGFLLAFIEHGSNFALIRNLERQHVS